MSFIDWDNLTSITRELVLPKIVDQIGKDHPTLKRFWDAATLKPGGKSLDIPVKYRHNSQGGSYAGLEALSANQENTRTRATFPWRQMFQPIVLSNIDVAKNGSSEVQIADLMEVEMEEAKASLTDKFATMLFGDGTGNGGKDFLGLKAAIDDSTVVDTYGGIVRSTYTWFKSNYTASVGSLTLGKIATMFDSCNSGADRISVVVTTELLRSAYEALLQTQVRFTSAGGAVNADGGLGELSFRGVPIISDEYVTAGEMFFINEKYVKMYYLKHPKHPTDSNGLAMSPLREPINQDGQVGYILSYLQMANSNPRRSGRFVGATA